MDCERRTEITDRMTDECLCCESCYMSDIEAIDTREEGRVWCQQQKREVNAVLKEWH